MCALVGLIMVTTEHGWQAISGGFGCVIDMSDMILAVCMLPSHPAATARPLVSAGVDWL